jgi:hypothetical protein
MNISEDRQKKTAQTTSSFIGSRSIKAMLVSESRPDSIIRNRRMISRQDTQRTMRHQSVH